MAPFPIRPRINSLGAPAVLDQQQTSTNSPYWWDSPPPGHRSLFKSASIATPMIAAGETTVLAFTAPQGFGGCLKAVTCCFSGTGYLPGSTQLTWRIKSNGVPYPDYGNLTIPLGAPGFSEVIDGALIFKPNEKIIITVTNADNLIAGGSFIIGVLKGWFVPESFIQEAYRG